ncbi:Elongation factor P hydroxylase [Pseudidiomarina piscicola]|uniref:Elongation factor P hydroxylase n=1 Tax=Pseudidiomarina piscicola TaxID=2614830 RepID=A0A6S6WLE0_9GAMM|nr:elongation factor P hydroxylase [Pseudidiomarina piscicola]CAB0149764.1 Elongation factor P hydroxylase [Pseudidiomarina piscicola]VZT39213.1 Elongation factor P hydroxylase [Pseudomonas aeruginosa]
MAQADYQRLITIFDDCFYANYRTRLVAGDDEPLYRPAATSDEDHQIIFAHGFFASALHEIAHWCIAGEKRRQLEDYGYWYEPDGRDAQQQAEFEQMERKPQALEMLFSLCAGVPFQVSVDNLHGAEVDREAFTAAVHEQLITYLSQGLPARAECFARALATAYKQPWPEVKQLLNYQGAA